MHSKLDVHIFNCADFNLNVFTWTRVDGTSPQTNSTYERTGVTDTCVLPTQSALDFSPSTLSQCDPYIILEYVECNCIWPSFDGRLKESRRKNNHQATKQTIKYHSGLVKLFVLFWLVPFNLSLYVIFFSFRHQISLRLLHEPNDNWSTIRHQMNIRKTAAITKKTMKWIALVIRSMEFEFLRFQHFCQQWL